MKTIAYLYLLLVYYTSRIKIVSATNDPVLTIRAKKPVIYVFWHEYIYLLIYHFFISKVILLLTPKSKADFYTRLADAVKTSVEVGSLEGGGRHALVTLIEHVKNGQSIAMSGDGARGPYRKCKSGCVLISGETDAPILPISWKAKRSFKIGGETLIIPYPFNSIEIHFGNLITVQKQTHGFQPDESRKQVEAALNRLSEPQL